jgi:hypothetical protein
MADLDVTKKLSVYHLLCRLNLSFTNIVRRCRELEETRVFGKKSLKRLQGFAQELQAEVNQELLLPLHDLELDAGLSPKSAESVATLCLRDVP